MFDKWKRFLKEDNTGKPASVVVILNDTNEVLILKRIPGKYWMADKWGLPAGAVDEGETYEHAAIRETKEETALDVHGLVELETIGTTHYYTTRKYEGQVRLSGEHNDYAWVSLWDLTNYDIVPRLEEKVREALNDHQQTD